MFPGCNSARDSKEIHREESEGEEEEEEEKEKEEAEEEAEAEEAERVEERVHRSILLTAFLFHPNKHTLSPGHILC